MQQAKRYIKFCVSLYNYQREMNRYFVHEHPWLATSWNLDFVNKLLANDDVQRVQTHMCQFGMTAPVGKVGSVQGPVLKPTGFMTNSLHIAKELKRSVPSKSSTRTSRWRGRAAGAAIYPPGLCRAICRGLAA